MCRRVCRFLLFLLLPLLFFLPAKKRLVRGHVVDADGPVAFASVRVQSQCEATQTDTGGRFALSSPRAPGRITATKSGYRIGWAGPSPFARIQLARLPDEDNLDYDWIDPTPDARKVYNCGNCHAEIEREWAAGAHARSAKNSRVLALFGGDGSPLGKDWNLLEQHPLGAGVCAACHAPTMTSPQLDYDLRTVTGVAAKGVHCDYCHKIAEAPLDKLGTRFGRDGYRLLRPAANEQLFFGPLPDAVRPGESFVHAPFYKKSRYCASCHEGILFGVHVYGTYSEWLESPQRQQGLECQSCHMAATGAMTNIAPGHGGIERDPRSLASHRLSGGTAEMLRRCLHLEAEANTQDGRTTVVVRLTATNVGHRVPTGFIDRHLVLVVEAESAAGKVLSPLAGPVLAPLAGKEVAGKAGYLYAKVLSDEAGRGPLPFWVPHHTLSDSRLFPGRADRRDFTFQEVAQVRIRVSHRRFWPAVADVMDWQDNEVVVFDRILAAK